MGLWIRSISATVVALAACQVDATAGVIFDNTISGNQGITTTSFPQLGGEVTVPQGSPLAVTSLNIGFTSQGVPVTADIQAFLYANDGAAGAPGTLLWSSAVMTDVGFNSTNTLYSFAVPSVLVPGTFTWTTAITNESGGILGNVPATGATIGTFDQAWTGSPGSFTALSDAFETEAQIVANVAVPEPSSVILIGSSIPFWLGYRRLRRNRAS